MSPHYKQQTISHLQNLPADTFFSICILLAVQQIQFTQDGQFVSVVQDVQRMMREAPVYMLQVLGLDAYNFFQNFPAAELSL